MLPRLERLPDFDAFVRNEPVAEVQTAEELEAAFDRWEFALLVAEAGRRPISGA